MIANKKTTATSQWSRAKKQQPKAPVLTFEEQAWFRCAKDVAKHGQRLELTNSRQLDLENRLENKSDDRVQAQIMTETQLRTAEEREGMLSEDINGIEQELKKYEELITNQMDEGTQNELASLSAAIREHDQSEVQIDVDLAKYEFKVTDLVKEGDEIEFECQWISQREGQKFTALMTKEVSCHLLSNKPFVCSIQSDTFVTAALIPGLAELKLTTCVKVYVQLVRQMYLRKN